MLNLLNFEDSLSDNPRYRWQIEEHEAEISDLECCLEKVLKHCTGYVDTGKVFCDSMGPFIESVDELANHFNNDPEIKETFVCFTEHLEEIKGFYSMLLDQTRCTILASVKAMMKRDIKNVKEHKKAFETKSDELDAALRINSTKNNKKKEDNQEAALSALADTKTSFHHTSVDYAYEINKIQMGKRFLITEKFLALMYAYYSFFHQGYASLNDIEPYLKNLNSVGKVEKEMRR